MSSLLSFSTSSASSDSENEIRGGNIKFDIDNINFNKTHFSFKNSLVSNLSHQTSKNSSRYFRNLEKKNALEPQTKIKSSTSPYSFLKSLKINNNLTYSKGETNYNNNKIQDFIKKRIEHSNHINLSKEFGTYVMESSSDSADSPNKIHFKRISKIKEINTSFSSSSFKSMETRRSKLYTKRKKPTINNSNVSKENIKPEELSLGSIDFSEINTNFLNSQNTDLNTNTLNLDEFFLDCSLFGDALIRKDNHDKNSQKLYPTSNTDNSFIRTKTSKPVSPLKPLQMNINFGIDVDEPLSSSSTFVTNLSDLNNSMNDSSTEYIQNRNVGISIPVSPLKPLQMNISYEVNNDELLSRKLTDIIYQSDLNDFMSDDSIENIQNQNISIFKPVSPTKSLQTNIRFKVNDDGLLPQKSTDDIINLPDLMNNSSTEDIKNKNVGEIKEQEHIIVLNNECSEINKSKSFPYKVDLNEPKSTSNYYFKSNAENNDSTSKYHEHNTRSKNKIKNNSQTDFEPNEKIQRTSKRSQEVDLNELELLTSNYSKSITENIDSTSKYHQYNSKLKNNIQIDSESKDKLSKNRRTQKRSNEVSLNKLESSTSNYSKSNAESIYSTSKYHQYNTRSKNKIKNTSQTDFESMEKKQRTSKRPQEVGLNKSESSTSNYVQSNAENNDSTSKYHEYNTRSKNKIKNNSQTDFEPNEKIQRTSKRSHEVGLNKSESSTSHYFQSNAENNDLTSKYHRYNSRSKNDIKNISIDSESKDNKDKERNKLKRPYEIPLTNISNILSIKKPLGTKNTKQIRPLINIPEDIGLEYDTNKDDYMVELPNGSIIPAFLSTLKPKYEKKLCACGIPISEAPIYWSESFHDILHQNIYKLRFKGNISGNDTINVKQNDLLYRILILNTYHYNDDDIKKSVKNIDDFVCLEYGIFKNGVQSYKNAIYLAVLPNFKVIGYLEVEPIHEAYKVTNDEQEQSFENKVVAKFGVLKIWVLIKYKNKTVDINLLEIFRKKEHLQKEDLAFSLEGCPGVKFIQKYTENINILIYNK